MNDIRLRVRGPSVLAVLAGSGVFALAAPGQQTLDVDRGLRPSDEGFSKLDYVARHEGAATATLTGGNGIYTVFVADAANAFNCGMWTAQTAALHPAGGGLDIIFAGGNPGTSYTTLRSYTSGTDYQTGSAACTALCNVAAPVITPIVNPGPPATTVGYSFSWTFVDGGNTIQLTQDLEVVGPVNGTETVDNSAIRETHTVANLGPGNFSFGLRKMWDWEISGPGVFDDGPMFGDCQTPTVACDLSQNMGPGVYPQSYVINEDPATIQCPPAAPTGNCGGNPVYIVAGTVAPPSNLVPPPDAPELLQFNSWPSLVGNCWQPALVNNSTCAGGDTAMAYFYGLTAPTALILGPGQQMPFTQYVVAGEETCPDIVEPPLATLDIKPGSCPNSFNRGSNGVLPVGLLGSTNFDVTQIDLATVVISRADGMGGSATPNEGPPGPHTVIADVGTPFPGELCDCHELEGDGIPDLSMKFRTQEVVTNLMLDDFSPGDLVELTVTGMLLDATEFSASDCVRLVPPGSPPGQLRVEVHVPPEVAIEPIGPWIGVTPLDEQLDGGGFRLFERTYPMGTVTLLTAAPTYEGVPFLGWYAHGRVISRELSISWVVSADVHDVMPIYGDEPPQLFAPGRPGSGATP